MKSDEAEFSALLLSEEAVKERPILFSAPMIRAILSGEKTQTRRILKKQPTQHHWRNISGYDLSCKVLHAMDTSFARFRHWLPFQKHLTEEIETVKSPYGKPGDRLWVRETWSHTGNGVWTVGDAQRAMSGKTVYRADADDGTGGWFPSIHMPRRFSRITLRITDVRVQRLQAIDERDAEQEGVCNGLHDFDCWNPNGDSYHCSCGSRSYRRVFEQLWESVNGKQAWQANPWVWAITFERLKP